MRVSVVIGTRPETIKMAPIFFELQKRGIAIDLVHTDQHYDHDIAGVFIEQLGLPEPDVHLEVGSGSQARQTAKALTLLEDRFISSETDVVLVQGDTNTVLAGALAATKLGIPVGHVEAGLRSHDRRMPEEYNRRVADHVAHFLYAPTQTTVANLEREGVWGRIWLTGNTVIDAIERYLPQARPPEGLDLPDDFVLLTAHRAENVDDPDFLRGLQKVIRELGRPVVYPLHHRTKASLTHHGLYESFAATPGLQLIQPVGYFEFMALMQRSAFILTDSGGIQEEVTAPSMRKRVFVMRLGTERPEAIASGHARVVGTSAEAILVAVREDGDRPIPADAECPYGQGDAARITVDALLEGMGEG